MTPCLVVQACELVDQLLQPSEQISLDISDSPVGTDDDSLEAEQRAVLVFGQLVEMVSRLTPIASQSATPTWSPAALIEEVSNQQTQLDQQQTLVAKICQAAALYAADAALLTPWSSCQLELAARTLLKQLCAAMPGASASQKASIQRNEQDLIAAMLPAILPLLSSALMSDATHSVTQRLSQQEGENSVSFVPVQFKFNSKPRIGPFLHLQRVHNLLMCLALSQTKQGRVCFCNADTHAFLEAASSDIAVSTHMQYWSPLHVVNTRHHPSANQRMTAPSIYSLQVQIPSPEV